ncbi:hypothetical protein [Modestobacter sp. VKM Ac-2978]|uniref:hypothetical protein n=1 Tax=Modestobacter sp. VKM Ac-2978 TaxID=3004132 RepID=UPI0022AA81FC|nr:hypothetical protein [Modestobacter sp. VKM Ac-2978]MCZ2847455.1 hypothetical protein [Modestobacter sp. VKM Ac-2978]
MADSGAPKRGRHIKEGLRWLAWSAAISLLPFGLTYAFRFYDAQRFPSISDVFGSGQGLLTALAMFAVALKELQGPRLQRTGWADGMALLSVLNLLALAAGYGFLTNDAINGVAQTADQRRLIAVVTLVVLVIGAATACAATTTASKLKEQVTGREAGLGA